MWRDAICRPYVDTGRNRNKGTARMTATRIQSVICRGTDVHSAWLRWSLLMHVKYTALLPPRHGPVSLRRVLREFVRVSPDA